MAADLDAAATWIQVFTAIGIATVAGLVGCLIGEALSRWTNHRRGRRLAR